MPQTGRVFAVALVLSLLSCRVALAEDSPRFTDTPLLFTVGGVNRRGLTPTTPPADMQMRVTMEGFLAETRIRMEVPNQSEDDQAEGVLDFELPAGSVVSGLKLSVGGMMVDGVGVEKWLARTAYEREVGRRVDPALLSQIGENRYRIQFFPIAKGASREVEITWIQPLRECSGRLIYDFPFRSSKPIQFSDLSVFVLPGTSIEAEHAPAQLQRMEIESGVEYRAQAGQYDVRADFTLSCADAGILGFEWTGVWAGERYASVRFPESKKTDPTVRSVSVIWDASLSHGFRAHKDEVAFLLQCLAEMGTRRVDLFELRNGIVPAGTFLYADHWAALVSALERTVFDGSSAMADVMRYLSGHPGVPTIFITDFLEYPPGPVENVPSLLAIVAGGERRWYDPVEQLRGATRGSVWYTSQPDPNSGARRIARILAERSRGAVDSIMDFDEKGNLRAVHGKGSRADETAGAERAFTLIADYPRYVEGLRILTDYNPRSWEYRDLGQLASRWNVVSPYSSLLVLETPEQYIQWGITPPAQVPWDRAVYDAMLKVRMAQPQQVSGGILIAQQLRKTLADVDAWLKSDHRDAGDPGPYLDFFGNDVTWDSLPPKGNSVGERRTSSGRTSSGYCFPAGTPVWTTGGQRIPIEAVVTGAVVSSRNPETGTMEPCRVTATHVQQYTGDMLTLHLSASELVVTGNHPILVLSGADLDARKLPSDLPPGDQERLGSGRWVEARDLRPGDRLAAGGGDVEILRSAERRSVADVPVYNLSVDRNRTYLTGAAGVVVHNKGKAEATPSVAAAGEPTLAPVSPPSAGHDQEVGALPQPPAELSSRQESFYGFATLPFVSESEAYQTYLKRRAQSITVGGFYVEAARWFASNGAVQTALLVLSNLRENFVTGDAPRIQGAMVFEALGMYDLALELLKTAEESSQNPGIKLLTFMAELYRIAGRAEDGRYILPTYLPKVSNVLGWTDVSKTQAIGGAQLTLYLDALLLSGGEIPDLSAFGMADLPGAGWNVGLRIKAVWPGNEPFGLMVVEPGGEAVFWDNFRSATGSFYWTAYYQPAGPDEYFVLHPVPGEYRIYLVLKGAYSRPAGSPDYAPVRVSVLMPPGTPGDKIKIFHVDAPYQYGYFPVGTVTVDGR